MEPKNSADEPDDLDTRGSVQDAEQDEQSQRETAVVRLKAQFLNALSLDNKRTALSLCNQLLEYEPTSAVMQEYHKVLQVAIAQEEKSGSEDDDETDSGSESGSESEESEEAPVSGADAEEKGEGDSAESNEEMGDMSGEEDQSDEKEQLHEFGEDEALLAKKIEDLRIQQEELDLNERKLWENEC